jgi:hypothetical protein
MTWPWGNDADVGRRADRVGRDLEVQAEVHFESGADRWWYAGRLSISETKNVRSPDLDPDLTDPRNAPILAQLEKNRTDAEVARWLAEAPSTQFSLPGTAPATYEERLLRCLTVVRRLRQARERANEGHKVRIYGLRDAPKSEERILCSVDQDLISEAPMIPYTQTEKGYRRVQHALFAAMGLSYVVLIGTMLSLTSSPATTTETAQQVSQSFQAGFFQILELIAIPGTALLVWWWKARSTFVFDIRVQPLVGTFLDGHTQPVFLTNSTHTPISSYASHVLHIGTDGIEKLTDAVNRFQSDTIHQLREENDNLRFQLDEAKLSGIRSLNESTDIGIFSPRRQSITASESAWLTILVVAAIASTVVGAVVYAVMASGA